MFLLAIALLARGAKLPEATITREAYGVPCITATTRGAAFYGMGRALAQDRLWQLEMSRRSAEGRLAEVLGPRAVASDISVLKRAYTEAEIEAQFTALAEPVKAAFLAYRDGVNAEIEIRAQAKTLPIEYEKNGFLPEKWTVRDSCSIMIMLMRRFGAGGAGELRNLGLVEYLKVQKCRDRYLDVIDDIAFQNEPKSPTTLSKADTGPDASQEIFPPFSRADTIKQLATMPKVGLLEIAGALGAATYEDQSLLAAQLGVPYKVGSYAIVVSPSRSKTGKALLLNGPQMGHSTPSVIHETVLDAPGLRVAGIDIPGVPLIAVGTTPNLAWGLTSGVADIEDIFVSRLPYTGGHWDTISEIPFKIKVKGEPDREFIQSRTRFGPALLVSPRTKSVFSLRSSYWEKELAGMAAMMDIYDAKTGSDIDKFAPQIPVTFNLFYATTRGETGFRYVGQVPRRAAGLDPRFPTPDQPRYQWNVPLDYAKMPQTTNPKAGLLVNWNTKSAAWWPSGDSPIWAAPFRSENITDALPKGLLGTDDLERAVWQIARHDEDYSILLTQKLAHALSAVHDTSEAAIVASSFDGWAMDGSPSAAFANEFKRALRHAIFEPEIGNLVSEALFAQAIPVGLMTKALERKTKYDFLAGRMADSVLLEAYRQTIKKLGPLPGARSFVPGGIGVPGQVPVPYIDRGTYIQVCELSNPPRVRTVASPGVAEVGEHAFDQVPLARAWTYKLQHVWPPQ